MLVGYMRVSKNDGSQTLDLQKDALLKEGIQPEHIYAELAESTFFPYFYKKLTL